MLHFFAAKSFLCLAAHFNPFWTSICLTMCALRWFFHNYAFPRLDSFCVASSCKALLYTCLRYDQGRTASIFLQKSDISLNDLQNAMDLLVVTGGKIQSCFWRILFYFHWLFDITETFDHDFFLNVAKKCPASIIILCAHTHMHTSTY